MATVIDDFRPLKTAVDALNDSNTSNDFNEEHQQSYNRSNQATNGTQLEAVSPHTQLLALLRKNAIQKKRTLRTTFCELFSPVLMISVLVFAYNLSEVTYRQSRMYADLELDLPGPIGDVLDLASSGLRSRLNDVLLPPATACAIEIEAYCEGLDAQTTEGDVGTLTRNCLEDDVRDEDRTQACTISLEYWSIEREIAYETDDEEREDEEENGREEDEEDEDDGGGQGDAILELRSDFNKYLKSPIPTPTFDQYITVGLLLSNSFDDATYNELLNNNEYGREWGNLFTLGTIHVVPEGDLAYDFIDWMNSTHTTFSSLTSRVHSSDEAAIDYINENLNERAFAVINLGGYTFEPTDIDFTIRMNYTTLPNTNWISRYISLGLNRRYQRYYLSGFMTMQRTLADFAFHMSGCTEATLPSPSDLYTMPMPTAEYDQNLFYTAVGYLLGLAISMGFLYPMSRLVKGVVEEKENRMKETMLILGVSPAIHWLSWVITAYISFTLIALMVTWVITNSFLPLTDSTLLFTYIWLFCASVIGFSFFVAAFFSRAKLAAIIGPVSLFASLMPRWIFYGSNRYEAQESKVFASILPCTAFAFGADILSDYEYAEIGVQSWNSSQGDYSFQTCLNMMAFDAIFYFVLAWYVEQVIPKQFGVRRPIFFFLYPSYWQSFFPNSMDGYNSLGNEDGGAGENEEAVAEGMQARVVIKNLVKQYAGAERRAVDELTLSMYENQITCLLGHNGAGKTTTISVLTGLYPPTAGDCSIYGNLITADLLAVRQSMGICPQHNVLFQELTVREHIRFFNNIKGKRVTEAQIKQAATDVGLADKLSTLSSGLSGGMKRKLSVCVALCGNPKFLLLDEPTSGMDPFSRRATWELLRKTKQGRVTLLTTHFMDEADILADRIAVMKTGKLQCVGSSTFLKKKFGVGYNLTFVTEKQSEETRNAIMAFLSKYIENPSILNVAGKEISFRLPSGSERNFASMFHDFEAQGGLKEQLEIGGYGISNTTLEGVFIRLAQVANSSTKLSAAALRAWNGTPSSSANEIDDISLHSIDSDSETSSVASTPRGSGRSLLKEKKKSSSVSSAGATVLSRLSNVLSSITSTQKIADEETATGIELSALGDYEAAVKRRADNATSPLLPARFTKQVSILFIKRLNVQRRDMKASFFTLVLPALLVGLVLLILTLEVPLAGPPLPLSTDLYTYTNSRKFKKEATTQIFNGGGSHGDPMAALSSHNSMVEISKDIDNDRIDWEFDPTIRSSHEMSVELLESYGDQSHATRFGSYIFNDSIPLTVTIDWPMIVFNLKENNWFPEEDDGSLPIGGDITPYLEQLFGEVDSEGNFVYSFDTVQISSALMDLGVNLTQPYNTTEVIVEAENAVRALLNTTNSTDDIQTQVEELILDAAIEEFVNSFANGSNTVTIQDVVDGLVEAGGGDPNDEATDPGWFTVKMKKVELDAETREVSVTGLVLIVGGGDGGTGPDATVTDIGDINFVLPSNWRTILIDLLPTTFYSRDTFVNNTHSIIHNASSYHAVPSFAQSLYESIYNQCLETPAKFSVINHPLPLTVTQALEIKTVLSLFASLFILIPYCYIPAAFVVFVVRERACKSKHLQLVSGVTIEAFWLSTFLFDVFLYFFLTLLIMLCFTIFGPASAEVFVGSTESFFCTFLVTFLYGTSSLPFAYYLSRNFTNHTTAQISVMGIFFITGFVFVNSYFIMSALEETRDTAATLVHVFRLFPPYHVGEALINLSSSFYLRTILGYNVHPFDYGVCGFSLMAMFMQTFAYAALVLLVEVSEFGGGGGLVGTTLRSVGRAITDFKLFLNGVKKVKGRLLVDDGLDDTNLGIGELEEDEDVAKERVHVDGQFENMKRESAIVIQDLWKVYPPTVGGLCCGKPKRAVRGMTAQVRKGEIFGLLGVNGAGKTTTLGILTGETIATSGEAWVAGYNVGEGGEGLKAARQRIGFCPQEDPLLELMTCRETLRMFARLRGIEESQIEDMIDKLMMALGLGLHKDKVAGALSGGNKRKLSVGVALIGDPQVLFIDEASSGMDPVARRKMWDLLSHLANNRSVVLTTHSMEEAEALCNNIVIMVSGRMRCLGSPQHLKTRFVDGLNIDVTCDFEATEEDIRRVERYMQGSLPVKLEERHGRFLRYSLSYGENRGEIGGLGKTFDILQKAKENEGLMILDYSIAQYSLESVFINLAQQG
eukprot:CAMPEP_0118657482 /NCGR_PEP_ID=MMETSP0785-20121206/14045_1 /TAXON_ID=91992 /ORGANISM="Bolidomonas pacifica, Strain CCMP 1866" /LENGTH=2195 /DNA_ID=CAMNT_0006550409 /DNA_START=65 /DNA_END=6648 /DNA_ORIENTATION=+